MIEHRFITLAAMLTVAGCVAPTQETMIGPSGQQMSVAKCSQSPSGCYQQASNTCQGSYQVTDSYRKMGGLVADVLPGPVPWYYMTYQCGPSDGRTPTFPFRGQDFGSASTLEVQVR